MHVTYYIPLPSSLPLGALPAPPCALRAALLGHCPSEPGLWVPGARSALTCSRARRLISRRSRCYYTVCLKFCRSSYTTFSDRITLSRYQHAVEFSTISLLGTTSFKKWLLFFIPPPTKLYVVPPAPPLPSPVLPSEPYHTSPPPSHNRKDTCLQSSNTAF